MNSAQVRAKARMAMKRREEEIETEEMEGGELNLVPYLDIVTNVMLFLLATVTSGLILGNINSALPEYSPPGTTGPSNAAAEPEEPPLQMVCALTIDKITLFSVSGLEGTIDKPLAELPAKKKGEDYDFAKLTEAAQGIVMRRFKGRLPMSVDKDDKPVCMAQDGKTLLAKTACRPKGATEVIMIVDAQMPYHVIISTMDALRQNTAKDATYPDSLLFPDVIFATGIK
jgi:biopolymer transport protein TolR